MATILLKLKIRRYVSHPVAKCKCGRRAKQSTMTAFSPCSCCTYHLHPPPFKHTREEYHSKISKVLQDMSTGRALLRTTLSTIDWIGFCSLEIQIQSLIYFTLFFRAASAASLC
eukprot:scaffold7175_cov70-Skeletonema_dohrnii-CCMP3373.AAC.1